MSDRARARDQEASEETTSFPYTPAELHHPMNVRLGSQADVKRHSS